MKLFRMSLEARLLASLLRIAKATERIATASEYRNEMTWPARTPETKRERKGVIISGTPRKDR